jgi:hypothetical protein
MARILCLYGSQVGYFGDKTEFLKRPDREVVGHPSPD